MIKNKSLFAFVMIVALLALQVGVVYAAPAKQATTIDGTVQSITQSTDSSGNVVFDITVLDSGGNTQTVRVSADTAVNVLHLVTDNGDGTYTINSDAVGSTVSIDSSLVVPPEQDPCALPEDANQPVGGALTRFFCTTLGIDYTTLETLHQEGFGYGEIAQACFMAEALGGTSTTCGDILMAKKNHDFSSLDLAALGVPEGTVVKNWGQLKKLVLEGYVKSVVNLGGIMSGRAQPGPLAPGTADHGNGNAYGHDKGNGNGNDNGNGNGNGHKP